MNKIVVKEYNYQWKIEFEKAEAFLSKVLAKIPIQIDNE